MDFLLPIIVLLVIVLVVLFLLQRRQRATSDVVPPPDIGQPIDYTNPDLKEPETLADRIRNAPLAMKLLVPLGALALLILCGVLVFTLQPLGDTANVTPTPEPGNITAASATLSNPTRILVQATTNLPDNTPVQAALLEDGQEFAWYTPDSAQSTVSSGRIRIIMNAREGAPTPSRDKTYTVALSATGPDGATVSAPPTELTVPQLYAADFYTGTAASAPTGAATAAATAAATSAPTAAATAAPTAAVTPTPEATATLTATVRNGGNVRAEPNLSGRVLDQNNAFEVVTLLEKTDNGEWYRMTNPRNITGWFSASLLTIDPDVAEQVPVQGSVPVAPPAASTTEATTEATAAATPTGLTGLVWNGGNVRREPNTRGEVLDQNNAGETVQLISKSADGDWYKITNPRGVTGWFSASLLRIDPDVIAQVPVER